MDENQKMVAKISDEAKILSGIEYDFSSKITILVGRNGSGKSSFLKALVLKQTSNWELSSDYILPLNMVVVENSIDDIGYYFAENSNKSKMSHFGDDLFAQIQDMKSSSGEATFAQVIRTLQHKLIILDEPDQSLDICNSIILSELLARVASKDGTKIILTIHSSYLLKALSELSGVKILNIETGKETTAKEYLNEQFLKAMDFFKR